VAADVFPTNWRLLDLRPDPQCVKCRGKVRLVAYRRNGGNEEYVCARCADPYDRAESIRSAFKRLLVSTVTPPTTTQPSRRRSELDSEVYAKPAEMPRRYTGPRAKHDPLR
jgi:hypothetical protein